MFHREKTIRVLVSGWFAVMAMIGFCQSSVAQPVVKGQLSTGSTKQNDESKITSVRNSQEGNSESQNSQDNGTDREGSDPEAVSGSVNGEDWSPIYPRRFISRYRPPMDTMDEDDFDLPSSLQPAADVVRQSTVTIRVDRPKSASKSNEDKKENGVDEKLNCESVAVFSGVIISKRFVATTLFLPASEESTVRITLPNGMQTIGIPRVMDEYSGLSILEIPENPFPPVKLCSAQRPKTGDWIVSGAAWGRKEALVSIGIISGIGYRLPSSKLEPPPLIVCDIRAAQTSKGAAIVGSDGKMMGLVIDVSPDNRWVYAVPSNYMSRLIQSLSSKEFQSLKDQEVLVLRRRVPRLGVGFENEVLVKVEGPAAEAGLKVGDQIVSVDGVKVRKSFDVYRDCSIRQAGDTIQFGVIRDSELHKISVTLGDRFQIAEKMVMRIKDLRQSELAFPENHFEERYCKQLMTFAEQNLEPFPCHRDDRVEELIQMLAAEREKNREMQARIDGLEKKLDRIIQLLGKD